MTSRVIDIANAATLDASDAVGWGWSSAGAEPATKVRRNWLSYVSRLLVAVVALAVVAVIGGFFVFVGSLERSEQRPEARADGIVALTGGSERIADAIDLLAQGYARRLLITGVNERTSRAEISRLNPGQRRLFECCVDLDYRARNTIGNAIETRRWSQRNRFRSLIVVTSNYHMPRTLVELEHALPGVEKIPYAVTPSAINLEDWWRDSGTARVLLSEYAKLLIVWVRTRLEADPERSTAANFISGGEPVRVVAEPLQH
jgi:uncharacterized SAM-binding protein YcdF (DUF218 family)